MKKMFRLLVIPAILATFLSISNLAKADPPPPPPPPGGGHGSTGNQGPMGAPIAGGIIVFVLFAAGYTGYEIYRRRKRTDPET